MLNRYVWSLCCLVGSTQVHAFECAEAQKELLALSEQSEAELNVADTPFTDVKDFVASKPTIKGKSIATTSFKSTTQGYEELWCKLKSQEAVVAESKLAEEGAIKDCADLNRLQLDQALLGVQGEASAYTLEGLKIELVADKDFSTGSQWAPSNLGLLKSGEKVSVQAMRLKSPTWLPIIGGMNYCKLLSPAGALELVKNQIANAQAALNERDASVWQKAEWSSSRGSKQSALTLVKGEWPAALQSVRGSFIISPGAEIPAEAMVGLANQLAEQGYLSFVIQYPNNSSIIENLTGRGNSAINLARKLKEDPQGIAGFDATVLKGKPVYVLGHSLGGATLAEQVYTGGEASIFDHIYLYGTSSFVKFGGKNELASSPITFIFGSNDGLAGKNIPNFLKSFSIAYDPQNFEPVSSTQYPQLNAQVIQGLNHFCIVSDAQVGNAGLKKKDGVGPNSEECVKTLVQAINP